MHYFKFPGNSRPIRKLPLLFEFQVYTSNCVPRICTVFYGKLDLVSARLGFPGKCPGELGGGGVSWLCRAGRGLVCCSGKCPGDLVWMYSLEKWPG